MSLLAIRAELSAGTPLAHPVAAVQVLDHLPAPRASACFQSATNRLCFTASLRTRLLPEANLRVDQRRRGNGVIRAASWAWLALGGKRASHGYSSAPRSEEPNKTINRPTIHQMCEKASTLPIKAFIPLNRYQMTFRAN